MTSPVDRTAPPAAEILFDGHDLRAFTSLDGTPARWKVHDGAFEVVSGAGDLLSRVHADDALIHLEFRCPHLPHARGQARANSGVYIQGRYEIQILDSHGIAIPGTGDCGAVYDQIAPLTNATLPPLTWQSYDIVFRAARPHPGDLFEPARLTLLHNGVVIHNNAVLRTPTAGALDPHVFTPGPLRLQDHGDPVQFRNIWLLRLPPSGSDRYEPG
ncbi:3-keto-disaccharide hydrolase [Chondromyces apiculatus]|uniref:Putative large, multifunctional secreted protein n=1 Tax=Chondromyces apiculatus DSM 436 TaxID=1192034 RepID=A0A017T6W9_9BACT|nr:DUF1080 domain-containing protein [Chondromyces apiculatus]EYF04525.1 putative large, multifunctional secreted protein [Chondromyces apiculatus DSM 436]